MEVITAVMATAIEEDDRQKQGQGNNSKGKEKKGGKKWREK
jgi:hypothetical protein